MTPLVESNSALNISGPRVVVLVLKLTYPDLVLGTPGDRIRSDQETILGGTVSETELEQPVEYRR